MGVNGSAHKALECRGAILMEGMVAVAILGAVMAAFAAAMLTDRAALKAAYYRAVAIEIVDGEMERLVAGEWQAFPEGSTTIAPKAEAARNLPDGKFVFTRRGRRLRLEWVPNDLRKGGRVVREVKLK